MQKRLTGLLALVLTTSLVLAACGSDDDAASDEATPDSATSGADEGGALPAAELALVAYSTPQEAYEQIIEAFQATPAGKNITFTTSFGGSGDQSRAVEAGLEADVVAFSLEPDMTRLVKAGLVAEDWSADEHQGMVTNSVVVLAVRKGNPEGIEDWDDLVQDGIEVVTPNPFTSGGARWNVMAAFGQATADGGPDDVGIDYLDKLFANVPVQDDSARKSLQTFVGGVGDVLLAYENEAIFAAEQDQPIDYVVPDSTILIENPVAVTSSSKHPAQAQAFLDFLRGPEAQQIFAENGYRPVVDGVESPFDFPTPPGLFTIADFGGWSEVSAKFFDPEGSIMVDVEREIGVSVG
jgi:sulfate/thiosulfate-binding protein